VTWFMFQSQKTHHIPVMLEEILTLYRESRERWSEERFLVFDGTFGGGGHAEALLREDKNIYLVAADKDERAIERGQERLLAYQDRLTLLCGDSAEIIAGDLGKDVVIDGVELSQVKFNFILLDLGLSSDQLDDAERGFSFNTESPLDMRMDTNASFSAWNVVNEYEFNQLKRVFNAVNGLRGFSAALAREIIQNRPLATTVQLAKICEKVLGKNSHKKKREGAEKRHAATIPFLAIRMETNGELSSTKKFLASAVSRLAVNGVLAVITFHSDEDRVVTSYLRDLVQDVLPRHLPITGEQVRQGTMISNRAILPTPEEVAVNKRARSAKLRAFRLGGYLSEV